MRWHFVCSCLFGLDLLVKLFSLFASFGFLLLLFYFYFGKQELRRMWLVGWVWIEDSVVLVGMGCCFGSSIYYLYIYLLSFG